VLELTGETVAVESVVISATVEGPISYCPWREGDAVETSPEKPARLIEINRELYRAEVNAAEVIARESEGRNLVVVGHFPFVKNVQPHTRNCWVIEKQPAAGEHAEQEAHTFIPQADVVAITGTAFVNHSMPGLLALCSPHARVMVLGPSTPLSPLLFQHGVHFLSGARVEDEETAVLTIQQAASLPQVKGVRLLTMKKEDWS
jgi:hypothetical protein